MNSQDTNRANVVIPDTDEARSLADRLARFLALGACQSVGADAAAPRARDARAYPIEQSDNCRSALPNASNQVGKRCKDAEPAPELGVDCEQAVSVSEEGANPPCATAAPTDANPCDEEGDQLCMSY